MIELRFKNIQSHQVEAFSDLLLSLGSVSVSLFDAHDCPVLEPAPGETPLWPEVNIHALFIDEASMMAAQALIQQHCPQLMIQRQPIEAKDWVNEWKASAQRIQFGPRLSVTPSHLTATEPQGVEIILDPGLAFGTGSHPTTALCLSWLDRYATHGTQMIDFGCGTGILMMAALKLGATHAYGIDIDPQALEATQMNAQLNRIPSNAYSLSMGEDLSTLPQVDLIMANILLNPLLQLKNAFKSLIKPNGSLVVSGLLTEQMNTLISTYAPDFVLAQSQTQDQWALIEFKLKQF